MRQNRMMHWRQQARSIARSPILNMGSAARYSSRTSWLERILREKRDPPPTLYAWSPANIVGGTTSGHFPSTEAADDLDRRIYILGVGNLGRLYASSLREHPQRPPVTLVVHRKELLTQWLEGDGIEIKRGGVTRARKDFDIELWTEESPTQGPVREAAHGQKALNLVIATKTSAVMPQVDRLRRYLDGSCTVALLQNGMSPIWPPTGADYVSQRFDPGHGPNFIAAMNNHGVYSEGPFSSNHASPVDTAVGPVLLNDRTGGSAPSVGYLSGLLSTAPHLNSRAVARSDLWVLQLAKLALNCTINPVTAVLRCRNGEVLTEKYSPVLPVIDKMLAEMSQTLQALINSKSIESILDPALQPALQTSGGSTENKTLASIRKDLTARFSFPQLRDVIFQSWVRVKDNNSSMFQDVRAGKMTEIRDLNGWIVATASFLEQEAREAGGSLTLDVCANRRLVDLVEAQAAMNPSELASHLLSPDASSTS